MNALTRVLYVLFGGLALIAGTAALLMPSLALPPVRYSPLTLRRPVHLALVAFTGFFTVIHWAEYVQDQRELLSPLVNTIPVLLLAATAPWGRRLKVLS